METSETMLLTTLTMVLAAKNSHGLFFEVYVTQLQSPRQLSFTLNTTIYQIDFIAW